MTIPCENCPEKLKGKTCCCGVFPFEKGFLEKHKDKFQASGNMQDMGNSELALTEDLLCIFLDRKTLLCAIYDERPKICRDYGLIDELQCPYFKRSGARRSPASEKVTKRKIDEFVNKVANQGKRIKYVR